MDSSPNPVRSAHARLAALRRHRPDDAAAIREARRDLVLAQAAALAGQAQTIAARLARQTEGDRG